jgi:YhcH/YjgK/YiaL family protein
MIIDTLANANRYEQLHPLFSKAFSYLKNTDFIHLPKGKYTIDGEQLFAIVNEYDTVDAANEQCEAHKKYIDIQFIVSGVEQMGHLMVTNEAPSKAYDADADYMLFAERPTFYSAITAGMIAIFFTETDAHMPNLHADGATVSSVKKVVVKVAAQPI